MTDPTPRFRFHPQSEVISPTDNNDVQTEITSRVDGSLVFVPDRHFRMALNMIFSAVASSREFCVTNNMTPKVSETPDPEIPHFQCMSSGTTGSSRRIRRTHESWIRSFDINAEIFGINSDDSYGITGALAHSLSLYGTLEAAYLGADIHALATIRPDRQYETMKALGTSVIYSTPTLLRQTCRNTKNRRPLEQVRLVFCGGGKLTQTDRTDFSKLMPNAVIREFYGSSETSFITIADDDTPSGSVGRPYPGVELEIRDEKGCTTRKTGELWVRSPYLFSGYGHGPVAGTRWHDGFLSIGELGRIDAEGFLFLMGRKSRMVTVADENVFPEEAETLLMSYPEIGQCTVISCVDPVRGNILIAVTDTNPGNMAPAVLTRARNVLGALKAPRDLIYLSDYPLLPGGKPDIVEIERRVRSRT